jgi:hypothetical protein
MIIPGRPINIIYSGDPDTPEFILGLGDQSLKRDKGEAQKSKNGFFHVDCFE